MVTITQRGDRLYVDDGLAFLVKRFSFDAWGRARASGTLFDLTTGDVQRDAACWGPVWSDEATVVGQGFVGVAA